MSSTIRTRIWSAMSGLLPTSGARGRWIDGDAMATGRRFTGPSITRAGACAPGSGALRLGGLVREDRLDQLRHQDPVLVDERAERDARRLDRDDRLRRQRVASGGVDEV